MKTLYKIIALTLIAATGLLAAGCRDCPTNGKLDNQWQIMKIEYPDGTVQQPEKLYYCFYRDIVQLTTAWSSGHRQPHPERLHPHYGVSLQHCRQAYSLGTHPGSRRAHQRHLYPVYTVEIDHLSDRTLRMVTSQGVTISCRKF